MEIGYFVRWSEEHPWDTEEENLRFVRLWLEMKAAKSTASSTGG